MSDFPLLPNETSLLNLPDDIIINDILPKLSLDQIFAGNPTGDIYVLWIHVLLDFAKMNLSGVVCIVVIFQMNERSLRYHQDEITDF